ncbi:hypothetical protein VTO73DRAFT_4294 [Trametes versicolor]
MKILYSRRRPLRRQRGAESGLVLCIQQNLSPDDSPSCASAACIRALFPSPHQPRFPYYDPFLTTCDPALPAASAHKPQRSRSPALAATRRAPSHVTTIMISRARIQGGASWRSAGTARGPETRRKGGPDMCQTADCC